MKRVFLLFLLSVLFGAGVQAQRTLTGTVADAKGEALYGVTVSIKNGKNAALTDLNGKYSINISDHETEPLFYHF